MVSGRVSGGYIPEMLVVWGCGGRCSETQRSGSDGAKPSIPGGGIPQECQLNGNEPTAAGIKGNYFSCIELFANFAPDHEAETD